ncbi:hypothetical protein, partial [Tritonibacter sp. SIMBA_163]|uniref:hypothetical protein n=1 Tax=Tritonibacter sp. SIMBA_163 TaxID=3080868 RepID=UPI00398020F1
EGIRDLQAMPELGTPEQFARSMDEARPDIPIVRGVLGGVQRNVVKTGGLVSRILGDQRAADRAYEEARALGAGDEWVDKQVA